MPMRALKYVFVITLIFILFCSALVPWENGYLLRTKYLAFITAINEQHSIYHVDIQSYQLGWLSSDVKLHLTIKNSQSNDRGFLIDQHIWHGPYVYVPKEGLRHLFVMVKTDAKLDDSLVTLAKLQNPLAFHLLTKLHFKGDSSTQYVIDPFIYTTASARLSAEEIQGIIKFNPQQPLQYAIHSKNVSLMSGDTRVDLTGLSFENSEHCEKTECKVTKKLIIPSIVIKNKKMSYGVDDIDLTYASSMDAENLNNYKIDFNVEKIIYAQNQFGPFVMNLVISNVNSLALKNITDNHSENSNLKTNGQVTFTSTLPLRLITNLPLLVTKNFVLSDDMHLVMPGGNITLQGKLLWPMNVPLSQDLLTVEQQLHLDASLHIDSGVINQNLPKLAEQLDAMIAAQAVTASTDGAVIAHSGSLIKLQKQWDDMVRQGYFVQDATGYVMTFTNDHGTIKTNGKILDFFNLMQSFYTNLMPKAAPESVAKIS
jgi:uncharacterized protein YdgA (DUF945 family)